MERLYTSSSVPQKILARAEALQTIKTNCSLTQMTFTFLQWTGSVAHTIFWKNNCWSKLGSNSTQAKPECGMEEEPARPTSQISVMKSGSQRASKSWALQLGCLSSCAASRSRGWKTRADSGKQSFAMCVEDPFAMCWASLPPSLANTPSESGNRVRTSARRRDVASDERFDGGLDRHGAGKDDGTPIGDTPHAPQRTRVPRMAPAAFWSSWADALQMIHQRLPEVADTIVESLDGQRQVGGCIEELRAVTTALDQQGFIGRPTWTDLKAGVRPPPANLTEPGECGTWLAVLRVFRF